MSKKMNDRIAKAIAGRKAEKEAKKKTKEYFWAEKKAGAQKRSSETKASLPKEELDKLQNKVATVKDLMAEAQARGIRYFRIMSKAELQAVIDMHQHALDHGITDPADVASIQEIQTKAKARWKAGWGKEKKQ